LIEGFRRAASKTVSPWVKFGIGDDCAVLQVPSGFQLLVTTDLSVENIHFRRTWHPAKSVGHRCLARGLSDIAAMGGEPIACFLSLALPPKLPQRWVDNFMAGFLGLVHRFRTPLAGGDTSTAEKITADIVVLGRVPAGKALLRSKARPGDRIWVSGKLGGSAAIVKRLYSGEEISPNASNRHFYPIPRLAVGRWLQENKLATAMIDTSDGLSVDLAHICEESAVDGVLNLDAIPIANGADLSLALHGGEDYELLFTLPRGKPAPPRTTQIGTIIRGTPGAMSFQGRKLKPRGYDHFI
jgi:thiamine-monophosphate kinase